MLKFYSKTFSNLLKTYLQTPLHQKKNNAVKILTNILTNKTIQTLFVLAMLCTKINCIAINKSKCKTLRPSFVLIRNYQADVKMMGRWIKLTKHALLN